MGNIWSRSQTKRLSAPMLSCQAEEQCPKGHARGAWTEQEQTMHINCLELLAATLSVKTFLKDALGTSILQLDNATAVAYKCPSWQSWHAMIACYLELYREGEIKHINGPTLPIPTLLLLKGQGVTACLGIYRVFLCMRTPHLNAHQMDSTTNKL